MAAVNGSPGADCVFLSGPGSARLDISSVDVENTLGFSLESWCWEFRKV
jgi:hypothetical protein